MTFKVGDRVRKVLVVRRLDPKYADFPVGTEAVVTGFTEPDSPNAAFGCNLTVFHHGEEFDTEARQWEKIPDHPETTTWEAVHAATGWKPQAVSA